MKNDFDKWDFDKIQKDLFSSDSSTEGVYF